MGLRTRILVTSSRLPCAVEEIRRLGRHGHSIHAADTFAWAPGNHSRWAASRHVLPSPKYEPQVFVGRLLEILAQERIELVVPQFEEVFFMMALRPMLPDHVRIFAPRIETLARLHDKRRFIELARDLDLRVPETTEVTSPAALRAAAADRGEYFARPAYSRGGVFLLTNTGPLAGAVDLESSRPSEKRPWVVQEFVHGTDMCSFSVVHHGRVAAHSTYVHPKTLNGAGGVVFECVEDPRTLDAARRVAEATGYHGQLSLDFIRTDEDELVAIECNPRPTPGVALLPDGAFERALLGPLPPNTLVAPAGARACIRSGLLQCLVHGRGTIRSDLAHIFSRIPDLYFALDDPWPGLYQFLSLSHVLRFKLDRDRYEESRSDLMAGYLHDITWDGELLPSLRSPEPLAAVP